MTRWPRAGSALAALVLGLACAGRAPLPAPGPIAGVDARVRITLLHFNDVYEIAPLAGWGGPARVATVRRELLEQNPNTITVLAGDFLSPSALSTAQLAGERLDGRQMVAVLNAAGLDFATLGNHEFDLREAAFLARLSEARFGVLSLNVTDPDGVALPGVRAHRVLSIEDGRGGRVRLALFGVTMDRDQRPYAPVSEPLGPARRHAALLRDSADIIVALTHLPIAQDIELAESAPEIDLIVGGHEHENVLLRRGAGLTPIAKADANFRTVWVHELLWDGRTRQLEVESRLVPITAAIADDPATLAVAERWTEAAFDGFRAAGLAPDSMVAVLPEPFDGRESVVYRDRTALTDAIAAAMLAEAPDALAALFNAGSIRLDDVLAPGRITEYDVIRVLPFGGPVLEVELTGSLLARALEQGERNRGTGGYLQAAGIERLADGWAIGGQPIEADRRYRVAVSDFLVSGREQGLDFLSRDNPALTVVRSHRDIRRVVIDALRGRFDGVGR